MGDFGVLSPFVSYLAGNKTQTFQILQRTKLFVYHYNRAEILFNKVLDSLAMGYKIELCPLRIQNSSI